MHFTAPNQARSIMALILVVTILLIASPAHAGLFVEALPQNQLLHDGNLHIFILGTGNPETEMQGIRKPACVALIANEKLFFFDAGEGCVQTAASLGLPYEQLSKVFMTHWHSDHFGGLGQLLNASWVHGRKQAVDIYGPYGTQQVMDDLNKAYRLDTVFRASTVHGYLDPNFTAGIPHDIDAAKAGTQVYNDGKLEISCFPVEHAPVVPAFGYTIRYGGAKIVISGDTTIVQTLEDQAKDADVLINESFSHPLALKEMQNSQSKGLIADLATYHSDSLELAKMAQRSAVKHLVLTHLVPSIATTDEAKQAFTAGMPELFKNPLTVADDGDHIIVKPSTTGASIQYVPQEQPVIPVFPRPKDENPMG